MSVPTDIINFKFFSASYCGVCVCVCVGMCVCVCVCVCVCARARARARARACEFCFASLLFACMIVLLYSNLLFKCSRLQLKDDREDRGDKDG